MGEFEDGAGRGMRQHFDGIAQTREETNGKNVAGT